MFMNRPDQRLEFRTRVPPPMKIAREALPFVSGLAGIAAAAGWLLHPGFAAPPVILLLFTLWFFRDPERRPPDDPRALISPADGKIIKSGAAGISIFMNVFDVHVCRAPTAGTVVDVERHRGSFLAAYKDAASEHNERATVRLRDGERDLSFTLVAGLVARRIVCKVRPGQRLRAGERIGLIRFGSRVDVDLPPGAQPAVRVGERVVAGETVLAHLGGPETARPGS